MKSFWKRPTHEEARLLERFKLLRVKQQFGRIFWKKGVFGLGTLRQAARQNFSPFKFTHFPPFKCFFQCVLFIGYQIWLERRSSRIFCFYFWGEVIIRRKRRRWASYFPRFRPMDPATNDARRYEAKEVYPRLGSLAARQTFFQAVDRLPHHSLRWLAS